MKSSTEEDLGNLRKVSPFLLLLLLLLLSPARQLQGLRLGGEALLLLLLRVIWIMFLIGMMRRKRMLRPEAEQAIKNLCP